MLSRFAGAAIWSAPAERSGDGALAHPTRPAITKAVSRFACHRTPYVLPENVLATVSRRTLSYLVIVHPIARA